jgi:hypothetical protein
MKIKLLLSGLAAAFLATGIGHAEEDLDDDGYRTIVECNGVALKNYHISDMELYRVEVSVEHYKRKGLSPIHYKRDRAPVITFDAEKLTLFVNGKYCRKTRKAKEKDCKDIYDTSFMEKSQREQDFRECMNNARRR